MTVERPPVPVSRYRWTRGDLRPAAETEAAEAEVKNCGGGRTGCAEMSVLEAAQRRGPRSESCWKGALPTDDQLCHKRRFSAPSRLLPSTPRPSTSERAPLMTTRASITRFSGKSSFGSWSGRWLSQGLNEWDSHWDILNSINTSSSSPLSPTCDLRGGPGVGPQESLGVCHARAVGVVALQWLAGRVAGP